VRLVEATGLVPDPTQRLSVADELEERVGIVELWNPEDEARCLEYETQYDELAMI
jgi:hypothetical protein